MREEGCNEPVLQMDDVSTLLTLIVDARQVQNGRCNEISIFFGYNQHLLCTSLSFTLASFSLFLSCEPGAQ